MWLLSLFDISIDAANKFYTWGWRISALGAMATVIGIGLLWWGTRVRDRDFEHNIAHLTLDTARANEHTAVLAERAESARLEIERVKSQNLQLKIQLEQEQAARAKIEAGLASRRVVGDRRALLISAIRKIIPLPRIQVQRIVGDTEARKFGDELLSALTEGGAGVEDNSFGAAPGFPDGLTVIHDQSPASRQVLKAFQESGLAITAIPGTLPPGINAIIMAGLKPPSF